MNALLTESVETLVAGEGLFSLLEDLAAHVDKPDFV